MKFDDYLLTIISIFASGINLYNWFRGDKEIMTKIFSILPIILMSFWLIIKRLI